MLARLARSARCGPSRCVSMLRRGSLEQPFVHRAAFPDRRGRLCGTNLPFTCIDPIYFHAVVQLRCLQLEVMLCLLAEIQFLCRQP
jgi:hypothetical protein